MSLYYCDLSNAQPLALLILVAWMIFLFSALGIVAGDFLAVNLGSIAQYLNISDTLAGVTFLALGNGAPDIFSTIAAMKESSNNLALGELIGAAAFITGVVAGTMALMKPFKVDRVSFLRDALFLLGTISFLHYVLDDGYLRMWHCIVLLAIYITYISVVLAWHWWRNHRTNPDVDNSTSIHAAEHQASTSISEHDPLLAQAGSRWPPGVHHEEQHSYPSQRQRSRRQSTASVLLKSRLDPILSNLRSACDKVPVPKLVSSARRWIMLPARLAFQLTIPCVREKQSVSALPGEDDPKDIDDQTWNRWLTAVHCLTSPQMITWFIFRQLDWDSSEMLVPSLVCLGCSVLLAALVLLTTNSDTGKPGWYKILCLPGFLVSIVWISSLADEMVAILGLLGLICNISNAIMGITVFAIGNSIDDWAANVSVARRNHPLMAFGACFGGPLLNILIGISISGIQGILRARGLDGGGSGAINLKPNRSLFFVSWSVVVNIGVLIALLFWTRWRMTRLVGLVLVVSWIVATVVNVVLEAKE